MILFHYTKHLMVLNFELKIDTSLNPIISNDLICVLTKDNSILVLESSTGHLVWSNDIDQYKKKDDRFLSREKNTDNRF